MSSDDMAHHLAHALLHLLETGPAIGQQPRSLSAYAVARQEARTVLNEFAEMQQEEPEA